MSALSDYLQQAKGDASIDDMATRAERHGHRLARSTAAKYLRGEHGKNPPESTLQALAAALGLDVRDLRTLAGRQAGELGPYQPVAESASLTQQQRDALDALIGAIVRGDTSDGRTPEAQKTKRSGRGSATIDPEGGEIVRPDFQQPPGTRAWAARRESRAVDNEPDDDEPR